MTTFKWHWGYLPFIILLTLLWFEFYRSSDLQPIVPSATTTVATPMPSATSASPVPAIAQTNTPLPLPTATPIAIEPPATADADGLPLLSLSVRNASLEQVVDALNRTMGPQASLFLDNPGNKGQTFTLDAKDRPFWEIFKDLTSQNSLGLTENDNSLTAAPPGFSGPIPNRGLALVPGGALRRFEINGPAILYPNSISYSKTGTGLPQPARAFGRYNLNLDAAIDPRIIVAHYDDLTITEALDDTGRPVEISTSLSGIDVGNFTSHTLSWTESAPPAKSISLKCELRFASQKGELSASLDDAQSKVGQLLTLGDRQFQLSRFTLNGTRLQIQISPANPEPSPLPLSFTLTDSAGKAVTPDNFSTASGTVSSLTLRPNATGPYHLTIRTPDRSKDIVVPFHLKDIRLP